MPEYLAPGVYVEETSFRPRSIEGVSTSTSAFVGMTLKGPAGEGVTPELLTSFGDFERIYGGLDPIALTAGTATVTLPNYLAHAVRAYFDNGGARLYVSRVVPGSASAGASTDFTITGGGTDSPVVRFVARFRGEGGNGTVSLLELSTPASAATLGTASPGSLLRVGSGASATYYLKTGNTNSLSDWVNSGATALTQAVLDGTPAGGGGGGGGGGGTPPAPTPPDLHVVTLTVIARDVSGNETSFEDLGLDPNHPRWIGSVLAAEPTRRSDALNTPFALSAVGTGASLANVDGFELQALLNSALGTPDPDTQNRASAAIAISGGSNGSFPSTGDYRTALQSLESLEDISIVAAPGYSAFYPAQETLFAGVQQELLTFVSRRRAYQIAVLDTPRDQSPTSVRSFKSQIDSNRAALYYPWVVVANPQARPGVTTIPAQLTLPPSGFVCGIYARNDVERGVFKAPANEVVRGAIRLERDINSAQQDVLNPLGINCLRFFPGRGYRLWGARTASSDPEWKYVNVRRYFNYLERSIDIGTQWAVFEPNGPALWTNIRDTISAFLYNEWVSGALLGASPQEAFFVRCDRSTMTQNNLDNGQLICLIGVAVLKPAEFVIFRIGQKTADLRG